MQKVGAGKQVKVCAGHVEAVAKDDGRQHRPPGESCAGVGWVTACGDSASSSGGALRGVGAGAKGTGGARGGGYAGGWFKGQFQPLADVVAQVPSLHRHCRRW